MSELKAPRTGQFTIVLDIDHFGDEWESNAAVDALLALPDVVEVEGPTVNGDLGVSFEMEHMDRNNITKHVDDATRAVLNASTAFKTRRNSGDMSEEPV